MPGRPISAAQLARLQGEFEPAGDQVNGARLASGSVTPDKLSEAYALSTAQTSLAQQVAHNASDQDAVNEAVSTSLANEVAARAAADTSERVAREGADSALGLRIDALPTAADISDAIAAALPDLFPDDQILTLLASDGVTVVTLTVSKKGLISGIA